MTIPEPATGVSLVDLTDRLAVAIVAALLVAFTIWSYTGHPTATVPPHPDRGGASTRRAVVALLTALRPSLGAEEDPKVPSVLLIGVDTSEIIDESRG